MGKKYFIMSDTHSFFKQMKETLDNVGFDLNNPDHIFILCGDLFDRGKESFEILEFVKNQIPKERRILIRGNHEYLLKDLLKKPYPESYDYSNGTVLTCCSLVGKEIALAYDTYFNCVDYKVWKEVKKEIKQTGIVDWIFSDEWVNYYELGNLVLVHSFIPLKGESDAPSYYLRGNIYKKYRKDWRRASLKNWENATWGCPYRLFLDNLFDEEIKKGKILVCGHWHTSDFHQVCSFLKDNFQEIPEEEYFKENYEIFYSKHLIALDACTARSKHCNILVVEEEQDGTMSLYDRFNNKLN